MKRKIFLTAGILLSLLLLCFVLLVPAAPLLVQSGTEPVCVQGDFPRVELVSCRLSEVPQAAPTPLPLPTPAAGTAVPLIFDDDGSPDGMLALLFFLSHPHFDLQAVTISQGEAHPQVFAPLVKRFMASAGRTGIPLGAGGEYPLQGENAFPFPWREASDSFWGVSLPEMDSLDEVQAAPRLMVETIRSSSVPVTVFLSGTHTNLAEALRLDPGIRDNIAAVYVMGGSLYQPGNIQSAWPEIDNRVAEWNIWVDPLAASQVFASGLPLYLMPLDGTRWVAWEEADAVAWEQGGTEAGRLAASLLRRLLRSWSAESLEIWDLSAAAALSDPRLCPRVPLAVEIEIQPGAEQGRTRPVEDPANIQGCLEPDAAQVRLRAAEVLSR